MLAADAVVHPSRLYPLTFVSRRRTAGVAVARELTAYVAGCGFRSPFVVASRNADAVVNDLAKRAPFAVAVPAATTDLGARRAATMAMACEADVIVAAGGGRAIDYGKVIAKIAGCALIAVPTQLSHDGLASPVAILTDRHGRKQNVEVGPPVAIFLPLSKLVDAPVRSFTAGLGDLLSNDYALLDWALGQQQRGELVEPNAVALAEESVDLVRPLFAADPAEAGRDRDAVALLATALINSGMAMLAAGTSRPASGAEHKISHAIDALTGGRDLHGAQVAFATVLAAHLHGCDRDAVVVTLRNLGLPATPAELSLDAADLRRVLHLALEIKPDRYTVLDAAFEAGATSDDLARAWPVA